MGMAQKARMEALSIRELREASFAPKLPECIDTPENRLRCMLASMVGMSRAVAEIIEETNPLLAASMRRQAAEAINAMESGR